MSGSGTATGSEDRCERPLLRRLTRATAWGEGLDGYDLGVLSVVLPLLTVGPGFPAAAVWARMRPDPVTVPPRRTP